MNIWTEFTLLFTEMGIAAAICLLLGIIFLIIEIFTPGFEFFGIAGIVLLIAGIILRVTDSGSGNPLAQLFLMLILLIGIFALAFGIMAYSSKKGWLSRTPIVESKTALPPDRTSGTVDYSFLMGKTGICATALRPVGVVLIDDKRYDVVADGAFIAPQTKVRVTAVDGMRVVVEPIEE